MNVLEHLGGNLLTNANVNTSIWSKKYEPKNITEWMDNYAQINIINDWFNTPTKRILIVSGHHGTGKTTLIHLMCKKFKKTMFGMHSNTKRNKKEILTYHNTIKQFTKSGVFVLDDFELFVNKHEYVSLNEIFKLLTTNSEMRSIIMVNSLCAKKLSLFYEVSTHVELCFPNPKTIFRRCMDILDEEHVDIDDDGLKKLKNLIVIKKSDVRNIIDSLSIFQDITLEERRYEMDMYDTYETIIHSDDKLKDKLNLFANDSGTIPIISQENYIDYELDFESLWALSDRMSEGDTYHKTTFMMNLGMCVDVYGCLSTLCITTKPIKKRKKTRFGLIWTKQSASYQKKKYINDYLEHTNDVDANVAYFLCISDMLKHFIETVDTKHLIQLQRELNVSDPTYLFCLYNAFTLRKNIKQYTKKSFLSLISKLLH